MLSLALQIVEMAKTAPIVTATVTRPPPSSCDSLLKDIARRVHDSRVDVPERSSANKSAPKFRVVKHVRGGGITAPLVTVVGSGTCLAWTCMVSNFKSSEDSGGAYSFVRLVCKGWSSAEKMTNHRGSIDAEAANHPVKNDPLSMRSGSCRDVLSPRSGTLPSAMTGNGRRPDRERERKKERERERERAIREKERCATTDLLYLFLCGIMEIFLKRFRNNKKEPFKISLAREKKDVHQPLKTTTEEETIERTCSRRMWTEKRLLNVSVNSKGSLLHALSRTVTRICKKNLAKR